ncbi:unnamed protein product [Caenorhabditis sp. 36 PRJEB53466]|nr:unnamed protein product [Caenorhabditis sp. 36 PRJEB53466]
MIRFWSKKNQVYIGLLIVCIILVILTVPRVYKNHEIRRLVYCDKKVYHDHRYIFFPMTSIVHEGGIGNQLFEVFSLIGMARMLNRTAIFDGDNWDLHARLDLLQRHLPQVARQVISIPIDVPNTTKYVYSPACCHFQISPLLFCEQTKFLLIDGSYFQSFKYFAPIENSIREWLKPSEKDSERLKKTVAKKDELRFKTCVHIRRGDFLTDGVHEGTNSTFTINAIEYLYTLHPGLVFLFSNDPEWSRTRIADYLDFQRDIKVMETPNDEALHDLYFSRIHCDAVLITAPSSTFGWWLGYVSKNSSNVYYRDIQEVNDSVKYQMIEEDYFPPAWRKMGMTRNKRIFVHES